MKKLLSILGAIGLTATSTTTLISCQKPNNNENGGGNKPEPKPNKPQQPPENSSWKIVNNSKENLEKEFNQKNDKWYIMIFSNLPKLISKVKYDQDRKIRLFESYGDTGIQFGGSSFSDIKKISLYRWDGLNEPQTPKIDTNTGKITDWKE